MATNKTISRGYVLAFPNGNGASVKAGHVSGVVSAKDIENMRKRFGGIVVNAKGLEVAYIAQGIRVLTQASKAKALAEATK